MFSLTTDASCNFSISVLDEYGYTLGKSGYTTNCRAEFMAGKSYQIIVEQRSGMGDYSLFIQKEE